MSGNDRGNGSRKADRNARLAEALRANLKRRREQVRQRAAVPAGPDDEGPDDKGTAPGETSAVNPPQNPVKRDG